jgi:peptide deformylase
MSKMQEPSAVDPIITDRLILASHCSHTTRSEVDSLDLPNRLRLANANAWTPGVGLAAIQIGIPLRYAWFTIDGREYELINPLITAGFGKHTIKEGCLSIPNQWFEKERFYEIEYVSDGKNYKAKGWKARIVQHEIDHCNGILLDGPQPHA